MGKYSGMVIITNGGIGTDSSVGQKLISQFDVIEYKAMMMEKIWNMLSKTKCVVQESTVCY
jgi:hypothetical protein